jgi:hypothetical protein
MMTDNSLVRSGDGVAWRPALYAGALLGGIAWGLIALFTVGAPGDQAQHDSVDGQRMYIAAGVWAAVTVFGLALILLGRYRVLRSAGVAIVIGPTGGWLIFASLALQAQIFGW